MGRKHLIFRDYLSDAAGGLKMFLGRSNYNMGLMFFWFGLVSPGLRVGRVVHRSESKYVGSHVEVKL